MKGIFWNIVERDGAVSLLLYGDVGSGCRVDGGCVVAELAELSARYGRIEVHINSRGGEVFEGMAIYNALRTSPADITVYVDGLAASIAGVIALCGKPLYMSRYARLMIHRVSGWASGNADEMRRAADLAESTYTAFLESYGQDLGMASYGACVDLLVARYCPLWQEA